MVGFAADSRTRSRRWRWVEDVPRARFRRGDGLSVAYATAAASSPSLDVEAATTMIWARRSAARLMPSASLPGSIRGASRASGVPVYTRTGRISASVTPAGTAMSWCRSSKTTDRGSNASTALSAVIGVPRQGVSSTHLRYRSWPGFGTVSHECCGAPIRPS